MFLRSHGHAKTWKQTRIKQICNVGFFYQFGKMPRQQCEMQLETRICSKEQVVWFLGRGLFIETSDKFVMDLKCKKWWTIKVEHFMLLQLLCYLLSIWHTYKIKTNKNVLIQIHYTIPFAPYAFESLQWFWKLQDYFMKFLNNLFNPIEITCLQLHIIAFNLIIHIT